jgi:hypothetical protein
MRKTRIAQGFVETLRSTVGSTSIELSSSANNNASVNRSGTASGALIEPPQAVLVHARIPCQRFDFSFDGRCRCFGNLLRRRRLRFDFARSRLEQRWLLFWLTQFNDSAEDIRADFEPFFSSASGSSVTASRTVA